MTARRFGRDRTTPEDIIAANGSLNPHCTAGAGPGAEPRNEHVVFHIDKGEEESRVSEVACQRVTVTRRLGERSELPGERSELDVVRGEICARSARKFQRFSL